LRGQEFPGFLYNDWLARTSKEVDGMVAGGRSIFARHQHRASDNGEEYKTMKKNEPGKLDTTLGDLIAAASEVAFEYSDNDREAYRLARLALVEILRNTSHNVDLDREFASLDSSSDTVH